MPALPAQGHHSFPAAYDVRVQKVLEGVATDFLFRNPHVFVLVAVTAEEGVQEQWALELPPAVALSRMGLGDDMIKAGDRLLITCNPARDGSRSCGVGQRGGLYRAADGFLYGRDPRVPE